MEGRESSYTVSENVNWYSHCEDQYYCLKKLKTEPPNDPAIPLTGIHPEKTWSERIHAAQCSVQHCGQQPRRGKKLNVH